MRIVIDRERCVGAGQCAMPAPALFDQDDEDGRVVLLVEQPPPGEEAAARRAVQLCPARAIAVEE